MEEEIKKQETLWDEVITMHRKWNREWLVREKTGEGFPMSYKELLEELRKKYYISKRKQ